MGFSISNGVPEHEAGMVVVGIVVVSVVVLLAIVVVLLAAVVVLVLVVVLVEVDVVVVVVSDPVGAVTASPINVTSVCESALPFSVAPKSITISPEGPARMVPSTKEVLPRVATPATCQKMFEAWQFPVKVT